MDVVVVENTHVEATSGTIKRWCRFLSGISSFVALCCLLNFLEGFIVNGITSINIPSFELQYQLPSTRSALIASATNIGGLACVLFVSYLGANFHKPIWTGSGAIVMAIGSLVFIIPHWTGGNYSYTAKSSPDVLCDGTRNTSNSASIPPASNSPYLGVFMLGNALHGAGYTPLYTLAIAYMDENESPGKAAFHVGLFYASAAAGVAVGFLSGGQFLQYYVDFDRVNMSSIDISPSDYGSWVGAWWLGYIVSLIGFIVFALPLFGYPKHMVSQEIQVPTEEPEVVYSTGCSPITKGFFIAILKLLKTPEFVLLTLGATCVGMTINGISSFSAKYLLEQFELPIDVIGYILGGLILVGSGGGMALGGILVRVFHLEVRGMARLALLCMLIGCLSGLAMLAKCPEVNLAEYQELPQNISNECDRDSCRCDQTPFTAVCDSNGVVYQSPCEAGCTSALSPMQFSNCSCLVKPFGMNETITDDSVTIGRCSNDCNMIYVLAPFLLVMFLAVFTITTPVSMATMRCVDDNLRSFALGLQWTVMRLLGFIPGPVILGAVIDYSCILWSGPDNSGVCLLYNKASMSLNVTIWWICVTVLALLLFASVVIITERKCHRKRTISKTQQN